MSVDFGNKIDVSSYVVHLSNELVQKAANELQEKPEWRQRDIDAVRSVLRDETDLEACLDDFFILRFLRAKKFDYDNAYKLITNYYFVRFSYPEIFQNFHPISVKGIFDDNILSVVHGVDYYGRKIILFKPGNFRSDSSYNTDDLIKALFLSLELILCHESVQVNGVCFIVDTKNVSLTLIFQHFKPTAFKKAFHCLQNSFPCRLGSIHFVNESHLLDAILMLLKPFLSEKIRRKMFFHGQNMSSLLQHIDRETLPFDLGGEVSLDSASVWFDNLEKSKNYFDYLKNFGYQASPSRSKSDIKHTLQQDGSLKSALNAYRHLCIDGLNK